MDAAARLVARELTDELIWVAAYLGLVKKDGDWIRLANAINANRIHLKWHERRTALAARLDLVEFQEVAGVVRTVQAFLDETPRRSAEEASRPLTPEDLRKISGLEQNIGIVLTKLRALGYGRRGRR